MNIVANGKKVVFDKSTISYNEIRELMWPGSTFFGESRHLSPSVTFQTADGRGGILRAGQYLTVSEGMIFNGANTTNA